MAAKQVHAGVVGPNGIGRIHVDALRRIGVHVAGVAAGTAASARRHAEALGVEHAYASADALVESPDIDVVHVCTPNDSHFEIAQRALDAGKHVVCEKPLATSLPDARGLLQKAEAGGRIHAVCYVYRYYPMARRLRALVADGTLGDVHLAHGTYLAEELLLNPSGWMLDPARTGPWLTVADVGIHWLDLLEWVTSKRVTAIVATGNTVRRRSNGDIFGAAGQTDDSDAVLLRLGPLISAVAAISQTAPGHGNAIRLELNGTLASARWEQEEPNTLWLAPLGEPPRLLPRTSADRQDHAPTPQLPAGHPQGYFEAFRDLMASIYARVNDPESAGEHPTFADGVRSLQLLEAFDRSLRSEGWTSVGPALEAKGRVEQQEGGVE